MIFFVYLLSHGDHDRDSKYIIIKQEWHIFKLFKFLLQKSILDRMRGILYYTKRLKCLPPNQIHRTTEHLINLLQSRSQVQNILLQGFHSSPWSHGFSIALHAFNLASESLSLTVRALIVSPMSSDRAAAFSEDFISISNWLLC